jgi:hypothetical protein
MALSDFAEQLVDVLVGKTRHDDIVNATFGPDERRVTVVHEDVEIAIREVALAEGN